MPNAFTQGYALLVGVGKSAYPKWSLPVTVKDMQSIRAILTDPNLCAYPDNEQHIRLIHDEAATRAAIVEGLAWLKEQAAADSEAIAVVFYSGHGWLDPSTDRSYLIPHDVEPVDIAASALPAQEFTNALREIQAKRLLVMIDCCHAGGMATAKEGPAAIKLPKGLVQTALPKGLVEQLKQGEGRAVFASSTGEQLSWIRPDGSLSIYTHHLVEALQGAGNKTGDTVVRLSNLMNHLGKAVRESARTMYQAEQVPFFDTATEDFAVAMLRGGKGLPQEGWEGVKQEAAETIRHVVNVLASGDRAVAIGGGMSGGNIITGDQTKG
ncbi:MAG TPA: caspase family protein [Isosphaeraceae bacterium]|nr:caspase family protein [Isosphaeraceae bacterium]